MESSQQTPTKNKIKNQHPKRFTNEQIKALESIFEQETKLEPTKKMQIARELSLHPRQVAIWFQNKRARWKSKRIEQEFTKLKSSYNSLSIMFDDLKKEKHSLQIQELNDRLKKNRDGDVGVNDDDDRIITSCYGENEDREFIFDELSEIPNWWES
ncbi:homeobox-leucine zipper protein ATHB-12-like isoform X2 [Salvia splendens]|uniref:homeobox-leucine zipper protein ATHB-12-like isoform X2 n=1 Tax=Salvia splendens TaxID=180675 RepID=UPI001C26F3BE|nr:homeobox-leucine zipper protein ATHB-12-like isoform X2 [Salvia splendens]